MASRTSDAPLKVTEQAKELVRYGAAVFECTQGEFVERAVADYLALREPEIQRRVDERQAKAKAAAAQFNGKSA
jgi:hypothetical protein